MKKISFPLIFFGNERLATGVSTTAPTLQALIAHGYPVAAVVANYTPGQSRQQRTLEVAEVAMQHNIPVLLPTKLQGVTEQLRSYHAAVGVLAAYGKIIPPEIIDIFPAGIINIHPSLLPLHRGPTPIESTILAGDTRTGASIMKLAKDMDAGPVYGQAEIALSGNEAKQMLSDTLLELGQAMMIELLEDIVEGKVVAMPQDSSRATYDSLITKRDGAIDWRKPAVRLEREIRAYTGWPGSYTVLAGKDVIITKAHVADQSESGRQTLPVGSAFVASGKELAVSTGEGGLIIDHLKPAGKSEMSGKAFLAGYAKYL